VEFSFRKIKWTREVAIGLVLCARRVFSFAIIFSASVYPVSIYQEESLVMRHGQMHEM